MNQQEPAAKVILITGAAKRIGKTIAQFLHGQGMRVIIHYRSAKTAAETLAASLNQERANSAIALYADLAQHADLHQLIAQAVSTWGQLDALVNNASAFYPSPVNQMTEQRWYELIDVNLKAPVFLAQLAVPWLKQQLGCIINISDIHGEKPMKNYPIYSISKAGLNMATLALARELAPEIRVNTIAPGATLWPEHENTLDEHRKTDLLSRIPLQRLGDPEEIAKTVLFLITSAYITGQILAVDGGRLLNY